MTLRNFMAAVCLTAFAAMLGSCAGRQGEHTERLLAVTVEPVRYFAERIAGESFRVVSVVPGGSNPEHYDPSPRQMVELSGCEAYLRIGQIGFEQTWIERMKANAPEMKMFDLASGISLVRTKGHDGQGEGIDPHLWNSPSNARLIARNIFQALCQLDPENKDVYLQNLQEVEREIAETDAEIRTLLARPHDETFLIYHPALTYYAREYGLRQFCLEEEGKEPSPARLKSLTDSCREAKVGVVFVQQEFDTRHAELISRETGTRLVRINPLSPAWREELIRTTQALCHE